MAKLHEYAPSRVIDFKSLIDGGMMVQWSFVPETRTAEQIRALPLGSQKMKDGRIFKVNRMPTDTEYDDMLFGWLVEAGVTSNSVLYVKDLVSVSIGTGGQDRFGMAQFARDKAYRNLADRLSWERFHTPFVNLGEDKVKCGIEEEVKDKCGGLIGSSMVSDAFFPFRDGSDVGLKEGVTAIIQPGGSDKDYETIEACNERDATMIFTGQRSFRH